MAIKANGIEREKFGVGKVDCKRFTRPAVEQSEFLLAEYCELIGIKHCFI